MSSLPAAPCDCSACWTSSSSMFDLYADPLAIDDVGTAILEVDYLVDADELVTVTAHGDA